MRNGRGPSKALERNPALKANFESSVQELRQVTTLRQNQLNGALREEGDPIYVPVVFHIVLQNPNQVTDAQVQAQLDVLNKDFAGLNGDSTKIPGYFKPLFGKSKIQFKLAQRTPNDEPSNGINRYVTTRASYAYTDNTLKYTASGGADSWDPTRYLNIWLTNISGGILGYATFPGGSVAAEQGVVVLYSSVPGGSAAPYNKGRTLTHETGHYFFLYHIWGDDDGACSGTDYVDDTPNQSAETGGCLTGLQTDACAPAATGKMYQNYMDYTDDACMVMFTQQQDTRMETAFNLYRASLLNSNGADPVVLKNVNASLRSINNPAYRVCIASFAPSITLRNMGIQTLTAANIYASIDGGTPVGTAWTGSLASRATTNITLNNLTTVAGKHNLKIYVTDPNATTDGDMKDDTLTTVFEYFPRLIRPLPKGLKAILSRHRVGIS
ncbi:M43 family zinc metalloprotease [Paraflavitalea speifideaquila]|uniref:M43 family zinc metalloprotease n=1 Tax=Paraflavitalea speifideaquila TaxID=3076558 RepID=UPI0028F000AD|nr:M43 family zinc metalloprotease [Paraflavitalea speifideiaquila]